MPLVLKSVVIIAMVIQSCYDFSDYDGYDCDCKIPLITIIILILMMTMIRHVSVLILVSYWSLLLLLISMVI